MPLLWHIGSITCVRRSRNFKLRVVAMKKEFLRETKYIHRTTEHRKKIHHFKQCHNISVRTNESLRYMTQTPSFKNHPCISFSQSKTVNPIELSVLCSTLPTLCAFIDVFPTSKTLNPIRIMRRDWPTTTEVRFLGPPKSHGTRDRRGVLFA